MRKILISFCVVFCALFSNAQRSCHTMDNHERLLQEDPEYGSRLSDIETFTQKAINKGQVNQEKVVITIPVVVHVLYNTSAQNVSDAQIQSQLTVLNNDFRKLNADASLIPSVFTGVSADAELNFCLATVAPNGTSTTGIIRRQTSVTAFSANDAMKYDAQGGSTAWPAGSYLNIWVCNLSGGLLGYAQFPGGAAATDGVVINYTAFGTNGTAQAPYNKGRTATHEVGHWLNLRHIWGDASCGSDLVSDTPVHQTSNSGCPAYPKANSCGTSAEMTMNYMDYTDDACMYMFTSGQKSRMQALFVTGGARASLKTSSGCSGSGSSTPTYCASNGANTSYEYINRVQLNTINNTTTASSGGYGNFTNLTTSINTGAPYSITLTPGFASTAYTEYFKVYIDYNKDMDFADAGENVYTSAGVTAAVTGSFTVPSTALTGSTRMRVIMSDAAISSPCGTVNYGEVEDYTVNIQTVSGTTCNAPANLSTSNLTSSTVTLNWGAVSGASGYSVQVKTSAASTWTTYSATTNTLSLTGLTGSTTYNWQVRTNCTSGSSGYTTGSNFTTPAATSCTDNYETNNTLSAAKTIPVNTNLTARIGTSTDIDWFKFTNTSAQKNIRVTISNLPFDYDLYLYNSAGTLLSSSENGGTTSELVKYNNGAVGTYYVRVRGYNGAFSGTACYTINASISSTAFRFDVHQEDELLSEGEESLVVYPNPSITGLFTCNLESAVNGMFTMQVTDASGRVLETREVNKQDGFLKTDINVSGYSNGIYYVRFLGDGVIMNEKLLYLER
jgi:hypothetical protein